ncbi:hypothetical protein SAMN05877809_11254 [Rhodobacter sp. JA431]|uniref:hypothetical protein n=1 Tax=Rhodobacter sp. JA431 TaxID=570013 RepID=UPI000BD5AE36|nr:hypothetical protein [Rhodobacter sp. JA431]SOC20530.1 hypothetical protein SAMN05877809_11254 [Rhodobacter sp. JA431]
MTEKLEVVEWLLWLAALQQPEAGLKARIGSRAPLYCLHRKADNPKRHQSVWLFSIN